MIYRVRESSSTDERELARRWWALPSRTLLPLSTGESIQLLFAGHPGSSVGPDVHDAVFSFYTIAQKRRTRQVRLANNAEQQFVGDVEFHLRSSDWTTHRHHLDPRYNRVMLHVVLICDDPAPTRRHDGTLVPLCSLNDLALPSSASLLPASQAGYSWPCQQLVPSLNEQERSHLLKQAGMLRLEQKTHAFVEQLHAINADEVFRCRTSFSSYDVCLLAALAEGLGYGRDRAFFRAVGRRLCGLDTVEKRLPEPLGHSDHPSPLDATRLRVLSRLVEQCNVESLWLRLYQIVLTASPSSRSNSGEQPALGTIWHALRSLFLQIGLSQARSDILIVNIVLPFVAAVGLIEQDSLLVSRAELLYMHHPGLPSNRLTRLMCQQLQLQQEPADGCQQQGLQYIYQQTCREKHCKFCIAGRKEI